MGKFLNWLVISTIICSVLVSNSSTQSTFPPWDFDCTGKSGFFPNPYDCNKFVLCEGGSKLNLYCRSAAPYFDKCNFNCSDDPKVCTECVATSPAPPTTTTTTTTQGSISTQSNPDSTTIL